MLSFEPEMKAENSHGADIRYLPKEKTIKEKRIWKKTLGLICLFVTIASLEARAFDHSLGAFAGIKAYHGAHTAYGIQYAYMPVLS